MRTYKQPGNILTFTAPSGGVSSGDGVQIGQVFVVAAQDADEATEFEGMRFGVHALPKATGVAWTEGKLLYWDSGNSNVSTVASGKLLIGAAAAPAASGDTSGDVILNGIARADES